MNDEDPKRRSRPGTTALPEQSGKVAIVTRGVDPSDAQEVRKRRIRVLIGDIPGNLGPFLIRLIERGGNCEVSAVEIRDVDEIENCVRRETFDLFILILNNISGYPDQGIELIEHLKATTKAPVIGLSGDCGDSDEVRRKVARVRPDAFYFLPFTPRELIETVARLLPPRSGRGPDR